MKRKILGACIAIGVAAVPVGASLAMSTASANSALCVRYVTFDHMPGATASTTPPSVVIDDGSPSYQVICSPATS